MLELSKKLVQELQPLTTGEMLTAPLEKLTTVEQLQSYIFVHTFLIERVLKVRRDQLKKALLEYAEVNGAPNEAGSKKSLFEGVGFSKEKRQPKLPDEDGLKALLASKEIPLDAAFTETKSFVMDPSKIQNLVDTGKLVASDVDALKPPTYALTLDLPSEFKEALDVLAEGHTLFETTKVLDVGDLPPKEALATVKRMKKKQHPKTAKAKGKAKKSA